MNLPEKLKAEGFNVIFHRKSSTTEQVEAIKDGNRLYLAFASNHEDPLGLFLLRFKEFYK